MKDNLEIINQLAPALVEALFNMDGVNTGLAQLKFDYTTSKDKERHTYHIVAYHEDTDWHPAIERATSDEEVTRFEVIDHRDGSSTFGRAFTAHNIRIEESLQDDGRTLKVFVTEGK